MSQAKNFKDKGDADIISELSAEVGSISLSCKGPKCSFSAKSINQIAKKCPELWKLSLSNTFYQDEASLVRLVMKVSSTLREIHLASVPITDTFVNLLADTCPNLEFVDFTNTDIGPKSLEYLILRCPIKKLKVEKCPLLQSEPKWLSSFLVPVPPVFNRPSATKVMRAAALNTLSVSNLKLGLVADLIPHCPTLQRLSAHECTESDLLLQKMAIYCPKLLELSLNGSDVSNRGYLDLLVSHCKQLKQLSVQDTPTSGGFLTVTTNPALKTVILSNCSIKAPFLKNVKNIFATLKLARIDLVEVAAVDDAVVKNINSETLTDLRCGGTSITAAGAEHILMTFSHLTYLSLPKSVQTDSIKLMAAEKLPKCKVFYL